jgi:nucleotide-binding universal stress UspA family protein
MQTSTTTETTDSMPSFKRVLVATDFSGASKAAFQTALRLCKVLPAHLSILHVFEYSDGVPPESGGELIELESIYEKSKRSLDVLMLTAQQEGVSCEPLMGGGTPSATILETLLSKQIDLAVLGTKAIHGFERLVFGSTAEAVIRKASCPVLTVGPQAAASAAISEAEGPIIFATDFNLTTTRAIHFATSFCQSMKSPLHCLHVLPRTLEEGFQNQIVLQIMTEALQHVASESGVAIEPPVCAIAYGSEISNTVVDYARKQKARLIVLGVRQASMMASHIPAHIAYRIITEAPCPVLTMAFASKLHWQLSAACL